MLRTGTKRALAAVATLILAFAACGDDDGGTVRNLDGGTSDSSGSGSGSASASAPASGSGSASAPASGSGSASAPASGSGSGPAGGEEHASGSAAAAECRPVGEDLEADVELAVTLDEWDVVPDSGSVSAGTVAFVAANEGEEPHELVIVKGTPDDLTIEDGQVQEDALPEGALIGEIEAFPAGDTCSGTFELEPGDYVLFCNIVMEHDGEQESHVELGMVNTLTVEG